MIHLSIMTRCQGIKAKPSCIVHKGIELYILITQNIRIWCSSFPIFLQKIREYMIPVFLYKIHAKQWKPQLIRNRLGIQIILFLRTYIILNRRISHDIIICKGIPVPHKRTGHIISLLLQQICRNSRIYPT